MPRPIPARSMVSSVVAAVLLVLPVPAHTQSPDLAGEAAKLKWRQIGPAIMGGRIADMAVNEDNPAHYFVGTATGGLWRTLNNGQTWDPVFDDQPTSSIGAVSLAPSNPNVVWVGTGEPQNRQSSPYGAGVFRSTDGGNTWQFKGLEETRHVGGISVHPDDPDVAYVAAVGHLFGPNPERGVYRTTDGGESWERVLFVDEHTGAIDLAMDPGDPETLFAAMYQRQRTVWGFSADGGGSGIYRTTDGGDTWTELRNGLAEGDMGRIGLDVYRRDGNLVYAIVEARDDGRGIYRSLDRGETWEKVSDVNPRPMYFSLIRIDPNDPERIYIGGVQFGISDDGARTFRDGDGAEGIHVDHHALWINPSNSSHLLLGSDGGLAISLDRAEHWRQIDNLPLGQFYEIGVSMEDPYTVCGGLQDNSSWCAPHNTYSEYGVMNGDWIDVSGGDGFYNKVDPTNPDIIYTESQGGNISRYDRRTGQSMRIRPVARPDADGEEREYRFNWNSPIHVSVHDPATVYIGANHLLRSRDRGVSWEEASPDLTRQIDRDTLEVMEARVTERTLSRNDGTNNYGNITTISESPFDRNLLFVGTDDGNVQVTRDGGRTWTNLTGFPDLPDGTYVSSVVASAAAEGLVYVTFDGHWDDDYRPFVYMSRNFGRSWQRIVGGLPDWSVNRIREHPRNPDLLFVGNEIGVYMSPNRGRDWHRLDGNLPTVPVDDIVIHPRDNDLILGTHGRSIWILDDIRVLEELSMALRSDVYVFPVRPVDLRTRSGGWPFWGDEFQGENPPEGAIIRFHLSERALANVQPVASSPGDSDGRSDGNGSARAANAAESGATLSIRDRSGTVIRPLGTVDVAGLGEVVWDLRIEPPYVAEPTEGGGGGGGRFGGPPSGPRVLPGRYTVALTAGIQEWTTEVVVRPDPRVEFATADREARQEALMTLYHLAKPVYLAGQRTRTLQGQIRDVRAQLQDREDVPEALSAEVGAIADELDEIQEEMGTVQRATRLSGAIEGSATRPTADQLWQIEQAWTDATEVIGRLNRVLEERMPALNRMLDENGIRPEVGEAVALPRRPGG